MAEWIWIKTFRKKDKLSSVISEKSEAPVYPYRSILVG